MKELDIAFENFRDEAELCFVKNFIVSPRIKKEYSNCLDILFNLTKTVDETKGLIAYNKWFGTGKSFFFDVVYSRCSRLTKKPYNKTSAKELRYIFEQEGQEALLKFISVKNLFIDDIGDEDKEGNYIFHYYNTRLNVLRYVLLKRYEFWTEYGWKTYGTTNLDLKDIGRIYDNRVADRLAQMVYFRTFDFLQDGESFRQSEQTRMLTKAEVKANLDARKPKEKAPEPVDLEKYFNELIAEEDSYFQDKDNSFWEFTKKYLIRKEILTKKDFDVIDEKFLDSARMVLKRDTREFSRFETKHTKGFVRDSVLQRSLKNITGEKVYSTAENLVARNKFLELREQKYVFV